MGGRGNEGVALPRCTKGSAAQLAAILLGITLVLPGSASAAGWLPSVNASPVVPNATKYGGSIQDVAVDAHDEATAVWIEGAEVEGEPEFLVAATRPAGGTWGAPVQISQTGEEPLVPRVVVDPDGDAAVVWFDYTNRTKAIVRAATRPAGGAWSQPVALSDLNGYATEPDIAIDPQGDATAIWTSEPEFEERFVQTATRPAGGAWSQPVALSDESGFAAGPYIAADSEGNLTAVWDLGGEEGIIQSKTRPAAGQWSSAPLDVSGEEALSSSPQIAVDGPGDVTAVWQQKDIHAGSGFHYFIQTARLASGSWSAPLTISREDGLATSPQLALNPDGNATVIWDWGPLGTGTATGLQARSGSADGLWGATAYVATRPGGLEPSEFDIQLAADPQGDVTAIWTGWSAPNFIVRTSRRSAGGTWSPPLTLSTGYSFFPRIAVDAQGTVTAVWSGLSETNQAVRSRVFDPVAPEIQTLEVPATGVVGQPVAMSLDASDVWSPVTASWDFGDGDSASGAALSHCYSTPGERTVTVTGTDGAANATNASRTITIEPDPGLAEGVDPCAEPEPPDPPQLTGTDPASPGSSATPRILGAAEAGSTVRVYAGSDCAGTPVAYASAAALSSPGIPVQVPIAITAYFSATATDAAGNTSACSTSISYTYTKDTGACGCRPPRMCIVPKLAGKTPARAKTALTAAGCKLGTIRKPRRGKAKKLGALVVRSSKPGAGAPLPLDSKVDLRLGPKKRR